MAISELDVPAAGRAALQAAFTSRLGAVDAWPGFRGLQVLVDAADPSSLLMISWWDSRACFAAYMQSDDHARSHARIPDGELRPHARRFRRFEVIAR